MHRSSLAKHARKLTTIYSYIQTTQVSDVQRLQMTTVADPNIRCLAIKGTFDDAQSIVKKLNMDKSFKEKHRLGAVNSINWARILAQIVYYFYAYFRVKSDDTNTERSSNKVSFSCSLLRK